jgi:hypothetical protein
VTVRWLILAAISCSATLSPEHLSERIIIAEHAAAAHVAACDGVRVEPVAPVCPETHDAATRCLALAAESYARCVTCCGCLDDHGACGRAYDAERGDCGPSVVRCE